MRPFSIIVACAENRVIGRNGRMPWSIPEDRRHFHERTAGQIVVLGRICFDTWPEALQGGRRAVVVTAHPLPPRAAAARTAGSLGEALDSASGLPGDIYVCGGQRIYEEAILSPQAARLYLTLVHAEVPGDRFFPDWRPFFRREIERREGADGRWRYTFLTLER